MERNHKTEQIAKLRTDLAQHGIVLPENILRVASGSFGTCFISGDQVLKLFYEGHKQSRICLTSTGNYAHVAAAQEELTRRGVTVPQLLDYGKFSFPIQVGQQKYYAWQRMTRVTGNELPPLQSRTKITVRRQMQEIIAVAAKIHVPVKKDKQEVSQGLDSFLAWASAARVRVDVKTQNLLRELQKDIDRFTPSEQSATLLHRDFHPRNILKSHTYGVIDWDQQEFGRPERDLSTVLSARPQNLREFCDRYNALAALRMDERLIVAYGLAGYSVHYLFLLQKTNSASNRNIIAAANRPYLAALAKRMHKLTGKAIYADALRDYSALGVPLPNPPTRRLPFVPRPSTPTA